MIFSFPIAAILGLIGIVSDKQKWPAILAILIAVAAFLLYFGTDWIKEIC